MDWTDNSFLTSCKKNTHKQNFEKLPILTNNSRKKHKIEAKRTEMCDKDTNTDESMFCSLDNASSPSFKKIRPHNIAPQTPLFVRTKVIKSKENKEKHKRSVNKETRKNQYKAYKKNFYMLQSNDLQTIRMRVLNQKKVLTTNEEKIQRPKSQGFRMICKTEN